MHIVKLPFSKGANVNGSELAPDALATALETEFAIEKVHKINMEQILRKSFGDAWFKISKIMDAGNICINIGGDHSVAVPTIYAANEFCRMKNENLGILWCDAHSDIHTIQTSSSANLHGMPVAILCGHTLPFLSFGYPLDTDQFCYFGLRDVDLPEIERIEEYKVAVSTNAEDVEEWIRKFDNIHVSFDVDCLSSTEMPATSTPVEGPLNSEELKKVFGFVKSSGKLISMDVVEFCPALDDSKKSSEHKIIEIVKHLL